MPRSNSRRNRVAQRRHSPVHSHRVQVSSVSRTPRRLLAAIAGRFSSSRRGCPTGTTSVRSRCFPTKRGQADGTLPISRPRRDRVSQGATVDERVRDCTRARDGRPDVGSRAGNRASTPGGEAIVAAPAAGRLQADVLLSIGDRVRAVRCLRISNHDSRPGPIAQRSRPTSPKRTRPSTRHASRRRAPNACSRSVPCPQDESRSPPGSIVAEARLQAAEARLAQRDETLRTGGGAAAGNAFALRAPIDGRLAQVMATLGASYDEGASLFRDRPHRSRRAGDASSIS